MSQRLLRYFLVVDKGAIPGATVADHIRVVSADDLGMVPRDLGAWQVQVAADTTTDQKWHLFDRDDAAAQCVVDFQSWLRHEFGMRDRCEGSS